jgi:2-methylcitrate dehydratase MmgE/PrpD-like protein
MKDGSFEITLMIHVNLDHIGLRATLSLCKRWRSRPRPAARRIFGGRHRSMPDIAAFVNGTMVRYLDYNDGYMMDRDPHTSRGHRVESGAEGPPPESK